MTSEDTLKRFFEFFKVIVNCWNYNCNIFRGERWFGRFWNSLVSPVTDGINNEPEVSMKPNKMDNVSY